MDRKAYPSDMSDEEWALVVSYLTLMREDAPQRDCSLREVFNGLRWIIRTGAQWRMMPNELPPWATDYQQAQRWSASPAGERVACIRPMVVPRASLGRVLHPQNQAFSASLFSAFYTLSAC